MAHLPEPLQNLINALERLPGIGPKSASRLAFFLLRSQDDVRTQLADALVSIKNATGLCRICHNITLSENELCDICSNRERNTGSICVVEEPLDVLAIERTGGFNGRYHVLHGVLSPIEGIGPDDIRIRSLVKRIPEENVREVIIATNPSMEGDATALYIKQQIGANAHVTRLARGLPVGGDLEYADQNTLLRALAGRQEID
jgi:recombination protein RecR